MKFFYELQYGKSPMDEETDVEEDNVIQVFTPGKKIKSLYFKKQEQTREEFLKDFSLSEIDEKEEEEFSFRAKMQTDRGNLEETLNNTVEYQAAIHDEV